MSAVTGLENHTLNKLVYANLLVQLKKAGGLLRATVRPNAPIGAIGVDLTDCLVSCEPAQLDKVLKVCRLFGMPPLEAERSQEQQP